MASYRMLLICILGAIFLNCSNYIFLRFHYGAGNRVSHYYYPKTVSGVEVERSHVGVDCDGISCDHDFATPVQKISSHNTTSIPVTGDYNYMPDDTHYCQELPSGLGPVMESDSKISIQDFEKKYSDLNHGGAFKPKTCESRQRVAVIIAYRGCRRYLAMFLFVLHPVLMKQQLDYQIFVVEQNNNSQLFNRGMLLNIGYTEAQKHRNNEWTCVIFHEAHIMPTDSRNLYRCSWYPRQLATVVERHHRPPYIPKFGGAVAMTPQQYEKVNGFSNNYWGNDADFEDLYNRVYIANYFIENSNSLLGKYKTMKKYSGAERIKSEYMQTVSPLYLLDGLTSLHYTVATYESRRLYAYIKVNIGDASTTGQPPEQLNHTFTNNVLENQLNSTDQYAQLPPTTVS